MEEEEPIQMLIGLLDSLQQFRSGISESVTVVLSHSQVLSLPWIRQCFCLIATINDRFFDLVSHINHPMSRWEGVSVEEYMSYTLCLLHQLNLITSSLSRLSQSRLWLSHALTLLHDSSTSALQHLKQIQPSPLVISTTEFAHPLSTSKPCDDGSKKDRIVHQAIQDINNVGSWVCGVVLSALTGNAKPYLETKRSILRIPNDSGFLASGLRVFEGRMEGGVTLKEVGRINDAVARLEATLTNGEGCGRAAEELRCQLKSLQREKEKLNKEVDATFSKILHSRNQLLASLPSC